MNIDWTLAWGVVFAGLTIVFSVLVILWGIIACFGKIARKEKKSQQVLSTLSEEELVAISAAIRMTMSEKFRIISIEETQSKRCVWKGN